MLDNYLITGYWGEPHVTAENDRGINAGIFGKGKFVLPVGEQFRAEYIGNNTVRMYDGKLMDNGAAAGIPAGRYVDLSISEAGQGMNRNDIICFQYTKDVGTLVERGFFGVIKGTETTGTATDPTFVEGDLLSDDAAIDIMALWRVRVSGSVISAPEQLFDVYVRKPVAMQGIETTGNGAAYEAKVDGVKELTYGTSFVMLPHTVSTSTTPTLNVNGLGAKIIRRRISGNSALTTESDSEGWLQTYRPVFVTYNGNYWVFDPKPNANDLYGYVPVENGGTGANTPKKAMKNLGGLTKTLLWENDSPAEPYPKKSLGVSVDGYAGFEVLYIADLTDLGVKSTGFIPYQANQYFTMDNIAGTAGSKPYVHKRTGYVKTYSLYMNAGLKCGFGESAMVEDNSVCIPYRVYGYENVSDATNP